ncbi:MAG TPA: hypothetical protein VF297_02295 [Pyrinomonadaceae bacterium]
MVELSEYVPVNLISLVVLGLLGLRKLVRMDGYHELRVVILTGLLWVPTIFLALLCVTPLVGSSCVVFVEQEQFDNSGLSDHFTISE